MSRNSPSQVPAAPLVNEFKLSFRQWFWVGGLVLLILAGAPWMWSRVEQFETGPDYRIPYTLSRDYWLFQRRLNDVRDDQAVVTLGDSVIWGEYVLPDGALTHFLNAATQQPRRFINAGVNGMFPLALEGLVEHYGGAVQHRKVLLHCNVLWMSSPKADLQVNKEEKFNHSRLVPQFTPRIACYRADANERLSAIVERSMGFHAWVSHLQSAHFGDKSIPAWTLQDDGGDPPHYPHAWQNPLGQITLRVPQAPVNDPQRGPASPRHKSWNENGGGPVTFDWVTLDSSLQWAAFQRLLAGLQSRGNDVLVVLGPFNEHMIASGSMAGYVALKAGILSWLREGGHKCVTPQTLSSALYADASHPLTEGYQLMAEKLAGDPVFVEWIQSPNRSR